MTVLAANLGGAVLAVSVLRRAPSTLSIALWVVVLLGDTVLVVAQR